MVDDKLLSLARDLRARAQEMLVRAETMCDLSAQQTMREVAARHEKFAERVEQPNTPARKDYRKKVSPTRVPDRRRRRYRIIAASDFPDPI
jgi:hypothetical protein